LTILIILLIFLLTGLLLFKRTATLHERIFPKLYKSVDFPEDRYPPADRNTFEKKVAAGYHNMKNLNVIICGLTKDDAGILPLTILRIEKTGGCFRDYRVIVYENDSNDNTLDILRKWEAINPRVKVITESIQGTPLLQLSRTEKLACFRNHYLQLIKDSEEYTPFDFVIVVDMDLKGGWSNDGIAASFSRQDWDIVASNSTGYHYMRKTYYDTFALLPKTILKASWLYKIIGDGWQFRRGDEFIRIQSGFGGLALYRKDAILSRQYSGIVNGEKKCEHISLNADNRLKCFLNPAQITVVGTQDEKRYKQKSLWVDTLHKLFLNW
jgi:glycosyltransferase involved in cell wall biosynthesis